MFKGYNIAPEGDRDFGRRILAVLGDRTKEWLAEEANLSVQGVNKYISGSHKPGYYALKALADALDVSADYLLGRDEGEDRDVKFLYLCDRDDPKCDGSPFCEPGCCSHTTNPKHRMPDAPPLFIECKGMSTPLMVQLTGWSGLDADILSQEGLKLEHESRLRWINREEDCGARMDGGRDHEID